MRTIVLLPTILSACFLQEVSGAHLRSAKDDETPGDKSVVPNESEKVEAEEKEGWNAYEKKKLEFQKTYEKKALASQKTFQDKKLAFAKKVKALGAAQADEKKANEKAAAEKVAEAYEKAEAYTHNGLAEKASSEKIAEEQTATAALKEFGAAAAENSASEKAAEEKFENRIKALNEAEAAEKKANEKLGAAKVAADAAKSEFSGKLNKLAAAAGDAAHKAAIEKAEKALMEETAQEKADKKMEALNDVEAGLRKIIQKAEFAKIAAEKAKAELAAAAKAKANSIEKADAKAEKAKLAKAKAEKYSPNL